MSMLLRRFPACLVVLAAFVETASCGPSDAPFPASSPDGSDAGDAATGGSAGSTDGINDAGADSDSDASSGDASSDQAVESGPDSSPVELVELHVLPGISLASFPEEVGLSAVATWSDGTKTCVNEDTSWTSDDPDTVSVSNASGERGLVSAFTAGTALISATFLPLVASAQVIAGYADPIALDVDPSLVTLPAGFSQQLSAIVHFTNNEVFDFTPNCTWQTSAPSVLDVDAGGNATGLAAGTAKVTAVFNSMLNFASVTVTEAKLVSIEVGPTGLLLPPGFTSPFTAIGSFSDGSTRDITADVVWSVSDPTRVEIVSGGRPGQAHVLNGATTATAVDVVATRDVISGAAAIDIAGNASLEYIDVTLAAPTAMWAGATVQASATGYWSDPGGPFTWDITDQADWSSAAPSVASVHSGLVRTRGYGTTTIGATFLGVASGDATHGGSPDPELVVTACEL